MWRSFFLAIGISMLILGGECLVIEKAVMARKPDPAAEAGPIARTFQATPFAPPPKQRVIRPPDWAAWTLLSAGAVVIIYASTLRRGGG